MLHNKASLAILLILTSFFFESCKKKTEENIFNENSIKFIAAKTSVKTYEIVRLSTTGAVVAEYSAQFGSEHVSIVKTSDTSYSFIIPDVSNGTYYLKFDSSSIKFNVSKTIEGNPDQLVDDVLKEFDSYILGLSYATIVDTPFVESLNLSKIDIMDMFNSLTADERKIMTLFYEANKEMFNSLHYNLGTGLNGRIISYPEKISECNSNSTKYEHGICKASFFVGAIKPLIKEIGDALITLPAGKWKIPFLTATYLHLVHGKYINELRRTLGIYFSAKWIFSEELFENINRYYWDERFEDLNLEAGFRTMHPEKDGSNKELQEFFEIFERLKTIFDYLPALGGLPEYRNDYEAITLLNNLPNRDIIINITDNKENVKLLDIDGESVKFNSVTDKIETFVYSIQVKLEGFAYSTSVVGTVTPAPLDTPAILVSHGAWSVYEGNDGQGHDFGITYKKTTPFVSGNCSLSISTTQRLEAVSASFSADGTGSYTYKDFYKRERADLNTCSITEIDESLHATIKMKWEYLAASKSIKIIPLERGTDLEPGKSYYFTFVDFKKTEMELTNGPWQYKFK